MTLRDGAADLAYEADADLPASMRSRGIEIAWLGQSDEFHPRALIRQDLRERQAPLFAEEASGGNLP